MRDPNLLDDAVSEKSESSETSGSLNLILSPEPSIKMSSPEPTQLPPEFLSMNYSQLNKTILSMSSGLNDKESDSDSTEENVFGSMENEGNFEDFSDDEQNVSSLKKEEEEQHERFEDTDTFLDSVLKPKGIKTQYYLCIACPFIMFSI